jgi:hypothetical protein
MNNLAFQRVLTEEQFKDELLKSYMCFLQYFFELKNNKPFVLSQPIGRQSHFLTIRDELEKVFRLETNRLIINVPPGYAKSTMLVYFVAWSLAKYPDSNFLYIAYSQELAEKHTGTIKEIITMPAYKHFFGIGLMHDSKAKSNFKLKQGGSIKAFGSSGSITGQDAGLPHCDRFSGGVIIDDAHKPTEVHSDTIRQSVIDNYNQTIKPRPRGPNVPIIFIGQRLHEEDLAGYLLSGADGNDWRKVVLQAIDNSGNALYPEVHDKEFLKKEAKFNPYVYSSQYQQNPQPAGGGIFKPEWFHLMDFEPEIVRTFITIDTAETDKTYNDASVFSFWGLYKVKAGAQELNLWGLHWIDCLEMHVEPKDLESVYWSFYMRCMKHKVKPDICVIEAKSTGTTLYSSVKETQGMRVLEIERSRRKGRPVSKIERFLECQPYVASRRISFTRGDLHLESCREHCRKITANNTHAHDDIADTMQTAIQCALIEEVLLPKVSDPTGIIKTMGNDFRANQFIQQKAMQWDY